ncbi:MAG: OmpH family outer membrane protein [Bacteroidales bacterium]|nr:OmpH family outer membrane protein [Bacteroidales bacterium]
MTSEEMQKETKLCTPCTHKCLIAINAVLLIGLVVLYILFFSSKPCSSNDKQQAVATANTDGSNAKTLSIGYIDTDSLMLQYDFAVELNEKLDNYARQENNYKDMMVRFQNDYNNFLKTGASLTLTEQKKTEESLKKRADELAKMEERLMNERTKLESVIQVEQKKMVEAVYAFIRDYNAKNQQFNVILKKSFSESPVLYMDDDMDITREIIDGLNEEYRNVKGK